MEKCDRANEYDHMEINGRIYRCAFVPTHFLFEIWMCVYVCTNTYVCMLSVNVMFECQGIERAVRGQPMLVLAFHLV